MEESLANDVSKCLEKENKEKYLELGFSWKVGGLLYWLELRQSGVDCC